MITDLGKVQIKRYLAGWETEIAGSIAFGVGESVESATQNRLDYEIGRVGIDFVTYDFNDDKLVFKGVMDEAFDGVIYEVGLFSSGPEATGSSSRLILSFDSDTEFWTQGGVDATYVTSNTRIGNDSMLVSPAASGSVTASYSDILMDLSGYTAADTFSIALRSANANISSLRFRFYTDTTNYYDITVPGAQITTGFGIVSVPFSQAAPTGTPRWEEITKVDVTVNASAGGAVSLQLEGVRIEDNDNVDPDRIMVARVKLATPFVKTAGTIQEVEFPLGVYTA